MSSFPPPTVPASSLIGLPKDKLPTIRLAKQKWNPKSLSDKQKTMIALHVGGSKRDVIAQVCECTPEYVSMVVGTDKAKQYMAELEEYTDSRLRTAVTKAVDAIHDTLDSPDEEVRLKAAKLALEANGKLKPRDDKVQSAEDVVAAILAKATVIVGNNVQVNQHLISETK